MTPERVADLVARWVRFYTRGLPPAVARRRVDEIHADLHDHLAHERARGVPDRRIALAIAARMLRGLGADASWRGQMMARASFAKDARRDRGSARRSALRVGLATAGVLLTPLVAMQLTDGVRWSAADFVVAGVLVAGAGLLLELAARAPRRMAYRLATVAIGVATIVLGDADDAPGLVLFGCLLIVAAAAMALRAAWRSG
jgi:hypothetical protein